MPTGFCLGALREREESKMGGMDWIDLAQDRERWRTVVNEVMNSLVAQNVGHFLNS